MLFDNDCPVLPPLPDPEYADIRVLLASASPRRRQLLGMIVPHFETVRLSDVKEEYPASLPPEEVPAFLSRLKADAYVDRLRDNDLMITADTIVIAAGIILGKPSGRDEAIEMLRLLSDSTHTVVTGVTLSSLSGKRSDTFSVSTDVHFARLPQERIENYVDRYRPFDKAGAYGVQEWIGAMGISRIEGSFYNVMGLPLHVLYDHLASFFQK